MAKEKNTQQIWKFTESQQLLLREQARQHQQEQAPLVAYQEHSRNQLIVNFSKELNLPEGLPVTVDLDNMQFIERPTEQLPPDEAFTPVEDLIEKPEEE